MPPDSPELTDADLMHRMAAGDEKALALFYDRHRGAVFGLMLQMLGDRPAAEEATLDIFLKVWQEAAGYREDRASARTWLGTIARHLAIDRLRRRRVRADQNPARWAEDLLETLPDPAPDAEQNTGDRETRRQVQAALAELPPAQREALWLAYFKGLSHSEIAAALGQPLGSVKTRIRSALLQLREKLER